jgi:hypothetical protein
MCRQSIGMNGIAGWAVLATGAAAVSLKHLLGDPSPAAAPLPRGADAVFALAPGAFLALVAAALADWD